MGTLLVIKANPVPDGTAGMQQALEAVAVHALLLEAADHLLDHVILLGTMRCDELLAQAIAFADRRKVATGEDQAIVRAQQEWLLHQVRVAL